VAISVVEQEPAALTVRAYPVQELAGRRSFEEVAYLLWHGELPAHHQIVAQNRAERARRALAPDIAAALAELPVTEHPLDTLRTAVSLLGASDPAKDDDSPAGVAGKALRLFAALPSVVAMDQRRRHGLGAIQPRDHLGYAANFLYMTFGKVPEPQIVAVFETSLILRAGDRAPAAACTARDPYDAVLAAIDALREPDAAGGGAVTAMLDEIAIPDNAGPWLEDALAAGRGITGFARRLGEPGDPRVPVMRAALGMVAALRRGQHLIEVYEALEAAAYEAGGLAPDLDYPSSPAYRLMGFDTPTFAPIFVTARIPGWTAALAPLPVRKSGASRYQALALDAVASNPCHRNAPPGVRPRASPEEGHR
jgi:citrate synthase